MSGAYMEESRICEEFQQEKVKGTDKLGDPGEDWRITLKLALKHEMRMYQIFISLTPVHPMYENS